jgi:hypothetical protein
MLLKFELLSKYFVANCWLTMDGWMDGWMDGLKSGLRDCLAQPKKGFRYDKLD